MNVVLKIGDREALPLRAIPYVTSWNESTDSIVHALAQPKYIHLHGREIPNRYALTAYQMNERGGYEEISASQWEQFEVTLDCATKKHQADERDGYEGESWAAWRISTTLSLPDNVFVWLDEFRQWYSTTRPLVVKVSDDGEFPHEDIRENLLAKLYDLDSELSESEWAMLDADPSDCGQEDDSLCLNPLLSSEIEGRLWRYEWGVSARTNPQHVHLVEAANLPTSEETESKDQDESNLSWQARARKIADELFDHDTELKTRDCLRRKKNGGEYVGGYAYRVMEIMQEREIHGPRGRIDNAGYIAREALQGDKWWANKSK